MQQRPNLPQFVNRMQAPGTPWWNNANPGQRMSFTSAGASGNLDFRGLPPNMAPPTPMGLFPGAGANFDPANPPIHNQDFAANIFGHSSGFPGMPQRIPQQEQQPSQFSKEVQDEANGYFQQLYSETGAMTVGQFIEKLKNFKSSENQKDQDILSCVLKNLFDEYRFFHEYPERALRITAEVYGGIIRESLLPNMMQLATAVRRIIQSLQQKEHGTPLYTFGILALHACKSCLHRYPKLCQIILGLDSFHLFAPALKEYVTYGAQGHLPSNHTILEQREAATPSPWPMGGPLHHPPPPGPVTSMSKQPPIGMGQISSALAMARGMPGTEMVPGGLPGLGMPPLGTTPPTTQGPSPSPIKFTQPGQGRSSSSMLNATNVDVLMNATDREGSRVPQPPPSIVERVAFLCNNLSQVNLRQKTEEIKVILRECGENFLRWFAQYLVMKRVTLEQNFQPLYNSFLLSINDENLDRYVKQETFRNIKILLRSDKGNAASNFGDRQLLKNLGLWLGQITISRNKPILTRDLDLKCLLFEAFYKGQQELLYVVPFVAKTLLSCTKSELFIPTCAWIFSIIRVLAEIHNEPDLKLNLKFEIEVLCKDLGIDLSQIEPTGVLKDTERLVRVPQQLGELASLSQPESGSQMPLGPPPMGIAPPIDQYQGTLIDLHRFLNRDSPDMHLGPPPIATPTFDQFQNLQQFQFMNHDSQASPLGHLRMAPPLEPEDIHFSRLQDFRSSFMNLHHFQGLNREGLSMPLGPPPSLRMPIGPPPMSFAPPIDPGRVSGRASANLMPPTSVTPVNELSAIDQAKHGTAVQPPSIFLSASFNYSDINVATLDGLAHHINIPANLPLFNTYPELKAAVRPAINQAVKELIGAIGERAISVAIAVTEQVCKKDFALDPNPQHLRRGAHQMARSMTAAMAWITCREPLQNTILGYLKHYFTTHLQQAATNPEIAKLIEEAVLQTMEANIELATNFIVKTACEQAMIEVDKRFEKEITARQQAAKELKTFGEDSPQIKIQLYMPESIRILPGPISDADMKIYDDYSSKICGFKPNQNFDESAFRNQQMVPPSLSQAQFPTQMGATRPIGTTSSMAPNFNQAQFAGQLSGGRIPANIDPNLFASQGNRMTSTTPTLGPDVSQAIIEQLRANRSIGNATPMLGMQPLEQHQLEQLRSKVELIVREWMAICFTSVTQQDPRRALAHIVQSMHREGILMTDETVTKFFHIYVNICVDVTHRLLNSDSQGGQISVRHRCYLTLDAFTKLTCLMVRYSDGPQHSTRINLLKKVLNIVTQALHHSHENRKGEFDGMPFMRIILNLFSNLARVNDPILDPISWNILESFGQSLFVTQPRRAPGFTFHWLTIIGHRDFIGRLLADESQDPHRTGAMYTQLLLCHIKFLAPYLRNLPLPQSIQTLLKGTLRVLLVILHDFPELLCEYHYVYCDYIPPDCIQLRNLILSAYPRNMRLPDPFNESMEMIENLQDMAVNPKAHREMANIIQAPELKAKLDEYLETRSAVNFLSELPSYLQVSQVPGSKYNSSTMNAIVLYVGTRAIDALQAKKQKISIQTVAHTPYMDIFQNLAVSLCTEGRHLLFNSIANQLRYPNSHTHYFSCTMLYLFLEANLEVIQEQITRILFQRLVALRPHPWGLLITFVELIRNPQYGFWGHEFIRCAPEIEQLFISVANSCNVNPQQILAQQKRV